MRIHSPGNLVTMLLVIQIFAALIFLSCGGAGSERDYAGAEPDTTKYYSPIVLDPEEESEDIAEEIEEPIPPAEAVEAPLEYASKEELVREPETVEKLNDVLDGVGAIGTSGGGSAIGTGKRQAAMKRAAASFDSANVAFNAPDSMQLGDTMRIMLLLSKKLSVPELSGRITEPGEIRAARIRTSGLMEANLKGKGFQIEPITKTIQKIDLGQETIEWSWQITAIEAGTRSLYLTIDLHTPGTSDFATTTINTLEEEIIIYVTWQQRIAGFVSSNWQWLWTTILVPFVGWVYNARKRKKEKAG